MPRHTEPAWSLICGSVVDYCLHTPRATSLKSRHLCLSVVDMPLPQTGEYFAFQINPVKTVEWLDDADATAACEKLTARRYLACVLGVSSFHYPFWAGALDANLSSPKWIGGIPEVGFDYGLQVFILAFGMADMASPPEQGIIPEMSFPVLPATGPHPLEREPLHCDPPLPWAGCYHFTIVRIPLRVLYDEIDDRDRGKYQLVPASETFELVRAAEIDAKWATEIRQGMHAAGLIHEESEDGSIEDDEEEPIGAADPYQYIKESPLVDFDLDLENFSPEDFAGPWELEREIDDIAE